MRSPLPFKDKPARGFTLIEMLVVLGMIAIILSLTPLLDFGALGAQTFHSDRDALVALLQHARGEAVSNICRGNCSDGKPHGVKIENDKFIMFQGGGFGDEPAHDYVV